MNFILQLLFLILLITITVAQVDWRTSGFLRPVENQGSCGSCVAFATSHSITDTASIAQMSLQTHVSPQDFIECCPYSHCSGCNGAQMYSYYVMSLNKGYLPTSCKSYLASTYKGCKSTCDNGMSFTRTKLLKAYQIKNNPSAMRSALSQGYTLIAGMAVYNDFFSYTSGVYQRSSNRLRGYHAIEIVGFGSGHWICKNSWGSNWGESGYFKIRSDTNEANIESVGVYFNAPQTVTLNFSAVETQTVSQYVGTDLPLLSNDTEVVAAATFAASIINTLCPSATTSAETEVISVKTIISAQCQIVSGEMLEFTVSLESTLCTQNVFYDVSVWRHPNGTLELMYADPINSISMASSLSSYLFLLIFCLIFMLLSN